MSKHYLISLVLNTLLFNNAIYESDVEGLIELFDHMDTEEILEEYLENI